MTAWNVWHNFPEVTAAFLQISTFPSEIDDYLFGYMEAFFVRLHDSNTTITSVNAARVENFYYKGRQFQNLPPIRDALIQHCLRAAYQDGHVWGQALISCPKLPDPTDWGWIKRDNQVHVPM